MTELVVALLICLLDLQAQNEDIALSISRDKVAVTSTFDGSDMLVFGAVKRETEIPEGTMHVIATISEPLPLGIVLRKERTCGIWTNRDMVIVGAAPDFYNVVTSRSSDQMPSEKEDLRHSVSIIGLYGQ